jgi:hypothetical protein
MFQSRIFSLNALRTVGASLLERRGRLGAAVVGWKKGNALTGPFGTIGLMLKLKEINHKNDARLIG